MPTYKVDRPGQKPRIVDAPNPANARAHVANDEITVTKITASEAFKLAVGGARLEVSGITAPETEAEQQERKPLVSGEEELKGN